VNDLNPQEIIDIITLDRITEVLQLRNTADPDDARTEVIGDLHRIRNMLVHSPDMTHQRDAILNGEAARAVITQMLHLLAEILDLEKTSLGTPSARRIRSHATAERVADIMGRHQDGVNRPPLLAPSEIDALFRVDPKTVTRWAQQGKLHSIRSLGGHRRYTKAKIQAFLDDPQRAPLPRPTDSAPEEITAAGVSKDGCEQDENAKILSPDVTRAVEEIPATTPKRGIPDTSGLCPDPLSAQTAADLIMALRQYRTWAGQPSFREMARRSREPIAASTLCAALSRDGLPSLAVVLAVVTGCGGSKEDQFRFATAWRQLRLAPDDGRRQAAPGLLASRREPNLRHGQAVS
jgi:hypothetical protein